LSARATRHASSTRTTRCCAWCRKPVRIPCLVCFSDRCLDANFLVQASTTTQMVVMGTPLLASTPRRMETLRLLRLRRSRLALRLRLRRQVMRRQRQQLWRRQRGQAQANRGLVLLPLVLILRSLPVHPRLTRLQRNKRAVWRLDLVYMWRCWQLLLCRLL
jgi:hypothetical protein